MLTVGKMTIRENPEKSTTRTQIVINTLYLLLVPVISITILLAWWFYPEPYNLTQEYISALGGYFSDQGLPNTTSSMIMTIGINVSGFITLIISIIYFYKTDLQYNNIKSFFNLLLTLGALGVATPQDHPILRIYHGIGAAVFIIFFGVLNSVTQLLRFDRKHRKPKSPAKAFDYFKDLTMVIIVLLTVVIFAGSYVTSKFSTIEEFGIIARLSQKVVLIVDCVAIFFLDLDDM